MEKRDIIVIHEDNRTEEITFILKALKYSCFTDIPLKKITAYNNDMEIEFHFTEIETVSKITNPVGIIILFGRNKNCISRITTEVITKTKIPALVISLSNDFNPNTLNLYSHKAKHFYATYEYDNPKEAINSFIHFITFINILNIGHTSYQLAKPQSKLKHIFYLFLVLIFVISCSTIVFFSFCTQPNT